MGEIAPSPIISSGRPVSSCTVDVQIQTGAYPKPDKSPGGPTPDLAALLALAFSDTAGGAFGTVAVKCLPLRYCSLPKDVLGDPIAHLVEIDHNE